MPSTIRSFCTMAARATFLALIGALVVLHPAAGGIGDLDSSFGTNGVSVVWFDLGGDLYDGSVDFALQPDGKILIVGYAMVSETLIDVAVARLEASGQLDPTFGSGGKVTFALGDGSTSSLGRSIAVQPNGKIIVAGFARGSGPLNDHDFVVTRLLADGSRDTGFGVGGETTISFDTGGPLFDVPMRVLIQPDGKIVAVGKTSESDTASDIAVTRLTPTGALDLTFGTNGKQVLSFTTGTGWNDEPRDARLQDDGAIVIGGWVAANGDAGDFGVARLLPSGALDSTFSGDGRTTIPFNRVPNGQDRASGLTLDEEGRILILGNVHGATNPEWDFAMARLLGNGDLDATFSGDGRTTIPVASGDGFDEGISVALDCTDRIVLLGDSYTVTDNTDLGFAALKTDGSLDSSFASGGTRIVAFDLGGDNVDFSRRLLIDAEGRPLALANVTRSASGDADWAVVRLTGPGSCLFLDGFESGNTSAWSTGQP